MPELTKSVGEGGANAVHDIALVQLMLRVIKDAKGATYLTQDYSGVYDTATKNAIVAFQTDQKLASAPNSKLDPATAAKLDKIGYIDRDSATLKALVAVLPNDYKDIQIIEGTKTVYLPMSEADAKASAAAIQAKGDLDQLFRTKVSNLVTQMYAAHKITLTIPADGWNRDFKAQAAVAKTGKGVGPGESNHQYGKAVDIGFNGLQWVSGSGQIQGDNWWLEGAKMPLSKRLEFWKARNEIAYDALGLSKTNKAGDFSHVQAYPDTGVSYGKSLAALLTTASSKKMSWDVQLSQPKNVYKSDLGLGGAKYGVGTALQIWSGEAVIDKITLMNALNAKLAADKTFSVEKYFGGPGPPTASAKSGIPPPAQVVLKVTDIKQSYLDGVKTMLQADFQAANNNRNLWKP